MNIIPAILTKDIADLRHKFEQLQGLTDWVQIDIMDKTLVNNTSITLEDLSGVEIAKEFSLEAHLMVKNPIQYFEVCKRANIKRVVFHIEAQDTKNILSKAESFGFERGLALNPETSVEKIIPYINQIDVVVLMSVNPGLQGQAFIEETLEKIKALKNLLAKHLPAGRQVKIEVDGGVNIDNIKSVADTGADYAVVGSGLFTSENIKERLAQLQLYV